MEKEYAMKGMAGRRIAGIGGAALVGAVALAALWMLNRPKAASAQAGTTNTERSFQQPVGMDNAPPPVARKYPGKMLVYDRWETFSTHDGLPSNEAKAIRVDGDKVWVGTDEGLACREQRKWRRWSVKDGLAHRVVLSLDVDPLTHDLWIGTAGGLSRLSGGRFTTYNQLNSGLANDVVYGVCCYKGEVWIATASGVNRYRPRTNEWTIFNVNNSIMFEQWCYAISASDDMVYVGVWGGGIVEYNIRTGFWRDYHDPDGELEITLMKDVGPIHEVVPAVSYENGLVWAGTYFGMNRYDGRHWKNYFKTDSGLASDFVNFVRAHGDACWMCTDDGLSGFDGTTWTTYRKTGSGGELKIARGKQVVEKRSLARTLPNNYLLGVDLQGDDIWVATAGGVAHGIHTNGPAANRTAQSSGAKGSI